MNPKYYGAHCAIWPRSKKTLGTNRFPQPSYSKQSFLQTRSYRGGNEASVLSLKCLYLQIGCAYNAGRCLTHLLSRYPLLNTNETNCLGSAAIAAHRRVSHCA